MILICSQFIEKGMRGGTSYIANRYGQGNNKYMQNYDKSKQSKYITYLDANNLYGWTMSQYLPIDGFRWITDKEINKANLASYKEDSKKELILEVDLVYSKELYNMDNNYPCGSKQMKVNQNMLSNYCTQIKDKLIFQSGKYIN